MKREITSNVDWIQNQVEVLMEAESPKSDNLSEVRDEGRSAADSKLASTVQ